MGFSVSSGFFLCVSRGRSHAAGRPPEAPRGRARQWLAASPPASTLRDCPARRRARHGIRSAERSARLPLLPNVWAEAGGAVLTLGVGRHVAGAAWRGVAPAVRQRSAAERGGGVWAWRSPMVNGDCHVSQGGSGSRSGLLWFFCPFFVRSGKGRSSSRRLRSASRSARKGSRDRNASAAWRRAAVAKLVFRSALTPEHAQGGWTARRAFFETAPTFGAAWRCPGDDPRGARHGRGRSPHKLVF